MDIIALILGFFIGVIIVGLAIEIGIKKITGTTPASKHTKTWNVSEISNPKVMAEYLSNVDLPKGSKVLVNKYKDKELLTGLDAREHKGIRGNFIVGDDRALILAGPFKKDEMAFWTVEEDIVIQLNEQFNEKWSEAQDLHQNKET
ncbi:MAG: hypothetical protein JSV67_00145 [Thermoplasmatales archaeon]|nr:MAG: hypothetical protein JSV67_00145 [Thermoplasmatales archaeon]